MRKLQRVTLVGFAFVMGTACGGSGDEVVSAYGGVTVAGVIGPDGRVETVLSDESGEAMLALAFDGARSLELTTLWDGATIREELDATALGTDVRAWNAFTYERWMSMPHPGEATSVSTVRRGSGTRSPAPTRVANATVRGTRDDALREAAVDCKNASDTSGLECVPVVTNVSSGSDPGPDDDIWSTTCSCT